MSNEEYAAKYQCDQDQVQNSYPNCFYSEVILRIGYLELEIGLLYFANGAKSPSLLQLLHHANQEGSVGKGFQRPDRPLRPNNRRCNQYVLHQFRNQRLALPVYIPKVLPTVRGKQNKNLVQRM